MSRRAPGLITLLLLLPLAACADSEKPTNPSEGTASAEPSEPSEPAEPSEPDEPSDDVGGAADDAVEGDGYTFAAPRGWRDATERFEAMSPHVDLGLLDAESDDAVFADNVNVIVGAPYPDFTPAEAEKNFLRELRNFARQPKVLPRVEIGDREAVHFSGLTPVDKIDVHTEQYAVSVDETWYIITFSHGPDTTAADREDDMSTVLDSWSWVDGADA